MNSRQKQGEAQALQAIQEMESLGLPKDQAEDLRSLVMQPVPDLPEPDQSIEASIS